MRFEFCVETAATPQQVLDAFTDFSQRRLGVWIESLNPGTYKVLRQGDTWAIAIEGSKGTNTATTWHYDWSEPGVIRWTALRPYHGGGRILIASTPAGGILLHVVFAHHSPQGPLALLGLLVQRAMGRTVIPPHMEGSPGPLRCKGR